MRMKRKVGKIEAKRKNKVFDLKNEVQEEEKEEEEEKVAAAAAAAAEPKFKDMLDSNLRNEEQEPEKEIMKNIKFHLF